MSERYGDITSNGGRPPGEFESDRRRQVEEFRARVRERMSGAQPRYVEADPPPVYDDVFFEGVRWMDENG